MSDFIPANELVRAARDVKRTDGSVAVPMGTAGIVENRDELVPTIYWVKFKGAAEAIAVEEADIERIPEMSSEAWVKSAMAHLDASDCRLCRGPLVNGEEGVCRGCADGKVLDAAVEADLEPGPHGEPAKPHFDTPLDA